MGLFQNKKSLKIFPKELNIFLIPAIFCTLIIGSFFFQHTGGANTVQFIITVFIIASIYAALSLYYWTGKLTKFLAVVASIAVLILTVSRSLHETGQNFLNIYKGNGLKLTNSQLESIDFLRSKTDPDSLLVVDPWMAEDEPSMYINYLSDRPIYLAGARVLRDHGHNTSMREQVVKEIYDNPDPELVKSLLLESQIKYIYVPPGIKVVSADNSDFLENVFDNGKFKIYSVI